MKKIIICTMMLIIATASFSQQTQRPTLTKQDYLLKSKHQKTAAWILLGTGILNYGLGNIRGSIDHETLPRTPIVTAFLITGLTEIAVSIPLFISAAKNKKKAMSLSFKNEKMPHFLKNNFVYKTIPSLSLKINL